MIDSRGLENPLTGDLDLIQPHFSAPHHESLPVLYHRLSSTLLQVLRLVFQIILGVAQDGLLVFGAELFAELAGDAHPQRLRLYRRAFRDHRPGGDDAPAPDARAVQDDAAHADEAAVLDGAAVQRDGVADGDPLAEDDLVLVAHAVQHAVVLDVGVGAHADGGHVAAQHGAHPDARVLAEGDIADELRGFVHVGRLGDARRDAFVIADHVGSRKGITPARRWSRRNADATRGFTPSSQNRA